MHITSNIFKISNSKITGSHQHPWPPNFESLPYPGVGGRFGIFSLKWRERMNLKVPGAILPLGCAILSTRAKTVRGLVQPPLRRTRVKVRTWKCRFSAAHHILLNLFSLKHKYPFPFLCFLPWITWRYSKIGF